MADPFAASAPPAAPAPALACPRCAEPMLPLALAGHYGRAVAVQLCEPCRLLWFDGLEAVTLTGRGWLPLLRRLQQAAAARQPWRGDPLACPVCRAALAPGAAWLPAFELPAALECGAGHGRLQNPLRLYAERGLAQPLLQAPPAAAECPNCAAPLREMQAACPNCASPPAAFDGTALAAALRPRPAAPLPPAAGALDALADRAALARLLDACDTEWWAAQQSPRPRVWTNRRESENTEPWRSTSFARLFGQVRPSGPRALRVLLLIAALLLLAWWWRRR